MNKKIIVPILVLAFAFSMASSVGAITDAQYQTLLNQLTQLQALYNQLLIQISGQTTATTIPIATTTTAPANNLLTITFPTSGSILKQGSTYNITWTGTHDNDGSGYAVYLVGGSLGSTSAKYLGHVNNSQTLFKWTVPSDITPGSGYQIQLSGAGASGDNSDSFSVVLGNCHTSNPWSWSYCSSSCKCNAGEGDCDKDSDCNTGYCAQNVGSKYGQASSMDICEELTVQTTITYPPITTTTTAAPITRPSITINSSPQAYNNNVAIQRGDQITITGMPLNLSGQMLVDYERAFFFDSIFNNSCFGTDWIITCNANQIGTSNFYIRIYKDGQVYQSNVIKVTVVDSIATTTTGATTWYTYKRCTDGRCVNHTTSVGPSADQCTIHADCTTTTTTGATTWYTYKRCTDGRCVNHTTSVGPSADQCTIHADCTTTTIIRLINSTLHRLSASLISLIESLKTINK